MHRRFHVMAHVHLQLPRPAMNEYMPFTTTTRVEIKESEPMPGLEGADELFKPTGRGDTKPTDRGDTKRATETKESWINVQTTTEPVKSELSFRVKAENGARTPKTDQEKTLHSFLRLLSSQLGKNVSALWVPQPESDSLVETNFGTNWERFVGDDILGPMTEALTHIRINCKNTSIRDMPLERMLQSSTLRTALSGIIKGMAMRQRYTAQMTQTKGSFTATLAARCSNEYVQQIRGHMRTLDLAKWNVATKDYT